MAEENSSDSQGAAQPQAQQAPQMRVLGQFVRDMSFENIMAQKGAPTDAQPDVQVQVNLDAKKRSADKQYETAIKLNVTSKVKESDTVLFVLEIDYVGIKIKNEFVVGYGMDLEDYGRNMKDLYYLKYPN